VTFEKKDRKTKRTEGTIELSGKGEGLVGEGGPENQCKSGNSVKKSRERMNEHIESSTWDV